MRKSAFAAIVFVGITALSSSAMAQSARGDPIYIGARSTNPEQETFGYYLPKMEGTHLLAFIGPARNIGGVTGDAEKDTSAYRPVVGVLAPDGRSFCFERE
ncbi:hypothetical protein [Sinorhizobium arboris]|uniref:hypothetical protein n=1 Tax=Sinorhizobium arboris TaxID=76745 RepID=UPI0004205757|nr:hypothetical protein [Sinorhizobium arboris]